MFLRVFLLTDGVTLCLWEFVLRPELQCFISDYQLTRDAALHRGPQGGFLPCTQTGYCTTWRTHHSTLMSEFDVFTSWNMFNIENSLFRHLEQTQYKIQPSIWVRRQLKRTDSTGQIFYQRGKQEMTSTPSRSVKPSFLLELLLLTVSKILQLFYSSLLPETSRNSTALCKDSMIQLLHIICLCLRCWQNTWSSNGRF